MVMTSTGMDHRQYSYIKPITVPGRQGCTSLYQPVPTDQVHWYTLTLLHWCTFTRYTYTQVNLYTGTLVHRYTWTKLNLCTGAHLHMYTCTQVHLYKGTLVHWYTGTEVHLCTGTGTLAVFLPHLYQRTRYTESPGWAGCNRQVKVPKKHCITPYTLHTAHYKLHPKLYTTHYTLYTAHCTLQTAPCTLHTAHCTCRLQGRAASPPSTAVTEATGEESPGPSDKWEV